MTVEPGLFGKLPEMGDFVARGLSGPERLGLDRWVTQHLVQNVEWPVGGLRGLLDIAGKLVLIVAVPSADKVGRRFPLVATTLGDGMSFEDADAWCDTVAKTLERATIGLAGVDEILTRLASLEPRVRDCPGGAPALWVAGGQPGPCDGETLRRLFSSG